MCPWNSDRLPHGKASSRCLVQTHSWKQTLSAPKSTGIWYKAQHTVGTREGLKHTWLATNFFWPLPKSKFWQTQCHVLLFFIKCVPETVTGCHMAKQAVGVWFRPTRESRPFRPPSRPAYGTKHNTQSVQGRVSSTPDWPQTSFGPSQNPNFDRPNVMFSYFSSNVSLKQWPAATWQSKQSVSGSDPLVKADPFGPQVDRHMVQSTTHSRYKGGSQAHLTSHKWQTQCHVLLFFIKCVPETVTGCHMAKQAVGVWFRPTRESRPFRPPSRPAYGTKHNTQSVQGRVSSTSH